MFQSFYNGLSGMVTSSTALDTLSDNVSNMQTPGFKSKNSFFTNIGSGEKGLGSAIAHTERDFSQGEVSRTGNNLDLFIDGNALFVLKDGDEYVYTRAGLFEFNDKDELVDKLSGAKVVGFNDSGTLGTFNIENQKKIPYSMTSNITLSGELSKKNDTSKTNVGYVDHNGEEKTLSISVYYKDDKWNVEVLDEEGSSIATDTLEFDSVGLLKPGKEKISVVLEGDQQITVNFGDPGSLLGTRLVESSSKTSLNISNTDGHRDIPIKDIVVDDKGKIVINYTNDSEVTVGTVALVALDNDNSFKLKNGHIFSSNISNPDFLKPGDGVQAKIVSGALELSNVDLAQEFADMMVIQRSYQASSRVMSISNQLIEQLYSSTGR